MLDSWMHVIIMTKQHHMITCIVTQDEFLLMPEVTAREEWKFQDLIGKSTYIHRCSKHFSCWILLMHSYSQEELISMTACAFLWTNLSDICRSFHFSKLFGSVIMHPNLVFFTWLHLSSGDHFPNNRTERNLCTRFVMQNTGFLI